MAGKTDDWHWFSKLGDLAGYDRLRTPIWIFDVERHAMWWGNESALSFWGAKSVEELRARDFSTDSQNVRDRLRVMVSADGPKTSFQEGWTLYPQGQPVTIVADILPVLIDDGRRAILFEASHPIDLQQDPNALRILEAARNTPLLVSTFTLEGKLLAQNAAAAECYGAHKESSKSERGELGLRFRREGDAPYLLQAAADDRTLQSDYLVTTPQGEQWHRVTAKRGRDPVTGQYVFVLTEEDISDHVTLSERLAQTNRDLEARVAQRTADLERLNRSLQAEIEERKRVEQDLRTQTLYLTTVLDNAPMAIVLKDRDGKIIAHGKKRIETTPDQFPDDAVGRAYESVVGAEFAQPVLEADRRVMASKAALQEEGTSVIEGRELHWLKSRFPLIDEQGHVIGTGCIATDITKQKEAEAHIAHVQKMEALGQLTGGVAHDFNNLLAVIHGNTELLADLPNLEPSLTDPILHAARRGAELTQRLLAFSRRQSLQPRTVDLAILVERITLMLMRTLGESIKIKTRTAPDLWPALADPGQVESVLLNLVLNARDAMPDGGSLTIDCSNAVLERDSADPDPEAPSGAFVLLTVSDDGIGMPAEVKARAFEPFFSTKGPDQGSGLGLPMVYGFAKQSGGHVTLESNEGEGTTVKLYLPRQRQLGGLARMVPNATLPRGKGEAILVVEDDDDLRVVAEKMLQGLGYRVQSVSDASLARQILAKEQPLDLLLSDVVLPGGTNGTALAREALAARPGLKVLFMSGYTPRKRASNGMPTDIAPLLAKPFQRRDLAQAVRRVLD